MNRLKVKYRFKPRTEYSSYDIELHSPDFIQTTLNSVEYNAASIIKRFLRNSILKSPKKRYTFCEKYNYMRMDDIVPEIPNLRERFKNLSRRHGMLFHEICRTVMPSLLQNIKSKYCESEIFEDCIVDGIPCYVKIYTSTLSGSVGNTGFIILPKNKCLDNVSRKRELQTINCYNINYRSTKDIQNSVFNILFHLCIIFKEFKYNSLFSVLYHKSQIEAMLNIKNFSCKFLNTEYEDCSVCLEPCIEKTICNHTLCIRCKSQIRKPECPLCKCSFMIYEDIL